MILKMKKRKKLKNPTADLKIKMREKDFLKDHLARIP